MPNKKHLAMITILVKDRQTNSENVNKLLTENSHLVMSRMGVNVQRSCIENCTGLIAVAVEGTTKEINDLTEKLDGLYGIVAKVNIMTE
jgi:metal-responsive CopG/Arc/MetJ family transcriptional regulator